MDKLKRPIKRKIAAASISSIDVGFPQSKRRIINFMKILICLFCIDKTADLRTDKGLLASLLNDVAAPNSALNNRAPAPQCLDAFERMTYLLLHQMNSEQLQPRISCAGVTQLPPLSFPGVFSSYSQYVKVPAVIQC
jgi:hypothetical protein